MIISDEHNFCFIHIPKCGGSTIRDQIGDLDSLGGFFHGRTEEIPGGPHQKAHLPLHAIRDYFPEIFERISGLEKIVIVRDPEARFLSAMSQRARETHGKFLDELTEAELRADFREIADHLKAHPALPSFDFRHFVRQSDFANLDGKLVVEHVVPLERISELVVFLSERTGRYMDSAYHSNQTVVIRNKTLQSSLLWVKELVKSVLPITVYGKIKEFGLSLFTDRGVAPHVLKALEKEGFRDFVTTFYADDYALLELGRSRNTLTGG
ncbi:hypothetical protein RGUI_4235 (plasmid) [Rhodovulum sp. P5]|uniref:sulfotransferase family 2 domain-containing protein n=1 Tax=Rhodovulum sp. P5 TaxID=1564506 RepID=UPI0009C278CA|nr:sulfotransferase family 2 domain-containing protein [Rhodovulum sp. P5]ARE42552.1 hypothetical protein RGUI_4235 [Rhodovulum sp. P5]